MVNIWSLLTAQPVPMLQSAWWLILAAWGIPTAVTGLFVWLLKRSIDKRDKRREAELPGVQWGQPLTGQWLEEFNDKMGLLTPIIESMGGSGDVGG